MMTAETHPEVQGELRENEPMSRHTSWRVGGSADLFFMPASVEDLSQFLRELAIDTPIFWHGVGSNLLVRDGGIRGVVISASKILKDLERVESVRTIDRAGDIHHRAPGEYSIAYRSVTGPSDEWFIEATFRFDPEAVASKETLDAMLERRKTTQPLGLPSCGSVFRNPPGDHAARLIQEAELKGHRIGGAEVSAKHANFIINADNATATDVEELIEHVRHAVIERHGVELVHEVRIVGEVLQ